MTTESTVTPEGPSLLIIGGTGVGKSHYGAQLLRRLQKRQGELRMIGTPGDLSAFQEVIDQLALGRSAGHTPSNVYRENAWQVRSERTGQTSKLIWPDYAGEQIEEILKLRQVTESWIQRLRGSDGWLLLVRPNATVEADDVLTRPRAVELMANATASEQKPLSQASQDETLAPRPLGRKPITLADQAGLVELLQALLFVREADLNVRSTRPALVVALSCWDELPDGMTAAGPSALLSKRLPLVSQFVRSNWVPSAFSVIGLSALGKPLRDDVSDEEFVEGGPERHGWCTLDDKTVSPDLTLPVALLMQHLSR